MIIKFRSNDSWVMFSEIDHLEHSEIFDGIPEAYDNLESVLVYPIGTDAIQSKNHRIDFFTKYMTAPTVIHAHSPIYLMNDNGKTIETI